MGSGEAEGRWAEEWETSDTKRSNGEIAGNSERENHHEGQEGHNGKSD